MNSQKLLSPKNQNGVSEISAEDLLPHFNQVKLVDVRRPDEFTGELGHIPGSVLVTLGEELVQFLKQQDPHEEMVFVCRSGVRSATACQIGIQLGFKTVINLEGGMIRWNELKYPTQK